MANTQFSLSWESHKKNICHGLSSLQQNGEFVDMTLAADGHMVKVHQVIVALASPYIKELIAFAQCQHPVIFLNKISYKTLTSILEYIYTGEVVVSVENLNNLIQAGRELHIKGLEDMNIQSPISHPRTQSLSSQMQEELQDEEYCYFEVTEDNGGKDEHQLQESQMYSEPEQILPTKGIERMDESTIEENENVTRDVEDKSLVQIVVQGSEDEPRLTIVPDETGTDIPTVTTRIVKNSSARYSDVNSSNLTTVQYTVSNQGSLQMILNRFVYYLKHTNRDGSRQWRCVDYLNARKCPAHVNTKDDVVQQRIASHNHTFHDKRILKKVKANAIFSAFKDAEAEGLVHKNSKLIDSVLHESE